MVTAIRNYQHPDETVSRIEVRNVRREQGKALLLLALLIAMTATFVWLGFKLMQDG